ncbi:MAG: hypothetical protein Q9169_006792 [Polycauliona sp. 2 TL-2023]
MSKIHLIIRPFESSRLDNGFEHDIRSLAPEQIAPDGVEEDGCHPDEAQALKDCCNEKTNATEAATAIVQPILQSTDPDYHLYGPWGLLMNTLIELLETQAPLLITHLDTIQNLPEPHLTGNITEDTPVGIRWKEEELPGFGHMWSDRYMEGHWRNIARAEKPTGRSEMQVQLVKKANVEARLVLPGVSGITLDWRYECIANALERKDVVLDFEIPAAAAEWLQLAGHQLFAGVRTGAESWALRYQRDFGHENPAMTMERWMFWEERMEELEKQVQNGVMAEKSA